MLLIEVCSTVAPNTAGATAYSAVSSTQSSQAVSDTTAGLLDMGTDVHVHVHVYELYDLTGM